MSESWDKRNLIMKEMDIEFAMEKDSYMTGEGGVEGVSRNNKYVP